MRTFLFITLLMLSTAAARAGDIIYFENGESAEVPENFKVIVVPKWVNERRLVQQAGVRVIDIEPRPEPSIDSQDCTPSGELSLGAPPCED